jgi:hypothetical protein
MTSRSAGQRHRAGAFLGLAVLGVSALGLTGCGSDPEPAAASAPSSVTPAATTPATAPVPTATSAPAPKVQPSGGPAVPSPKVAPSARVAPKSSVRPAAPPAQSVPPAAKTTQPAPVVKNEEPPPGPEVAVTLCMLTRAQARGVLGPAGVSSEDMRLRNGISALEENLENWRYAASGDARITPLIQQAESLIALWRSAVRAYDAVDKKAAAAAVAQADKVIAGLPAAPPAGAVGCPG